jgi:hypothetical protein
LKTAGLLLFENCNIPAMPMLHSCGFPGCSTRTLSTYCLEHEVLTRAAEFNRRTQAAEARDEPLSAERAEVARPSA